jgi:hypothetical protein
LLSDQRAYDERLPIFLELLTPVRQKTALSIPLPVLTALFQSTVIVVIVAAIEKPV